LKKADGIHYVRQNMGGDVHAFLLDDGNSITMIDALYDTEPHRIFDEIAAISRQRSDLKNIIATHAHRSYIGGMAELKSLSNARCSLTSGKSAASRASAKPRVSIWSRPPLAANYTQVGLALGFDGYEPCLVDQSLKEAGHVGPLTIVATPGHTPGSFVLLA
jgi:glyoxylase-like metal-dependent hydrolase (beta-lactamase superfamily II)